MASELGNQLLARVQTEMARNIATIKRQLIEWLERPESGGVDALRESMAEISGGLSLMEQEEAVALAEAIVAGVESLDQGVNEHGVNASFADKGAEIASGLLVLAGYIERLDHISDTQKQSVMQATAAVKTLLAGGEKIQVTTQPFISRETYQALANEVNKIIEIARNQIEQHIRNPEAPFNAEGIAGQNEDLIHLFELLELKTPQLLLAQVNQKLDESLTDAQWIEVAEALILVQETLKQLQEDSTGKTANNYAEALQAQAEHSRQLEIKKLVRDTGAVGKQFFESLRKEVLQVETVKAEQPWHEATKQLVHYSAVTALVGLKELSAQLQQLALLFAEFTTQNEQTLAKTYVPVIDALVAVEYLFDDLAESGKVSLQDVAFLKEAVGNIEKISPASAKAKALFVELANMAPPETEDDAENTGDIQEFKDVLGAGLEVLADDFSVLEDLEEEIPVEVKPEPTPVTLASHTATAAAPQSTLGFAQHAQDNAGAVPVRSSNDAAAAAIAGGVAAAGAANAAASVAAPAVAPATPAAQPAATAAPAPASGTAAAASDTGAVAPASESSISTGEAAAREADETTATATGAADAGASAHGATATPAEEAATSATHEAPADNGEAAATDAAEQPHADADHADTREEPAAITVAATSDTAAFGGQGAVVGVPYFADKSLADLEKLDIPAEKASFVGSHADAVMDEEIREFFNEELGEIVATMNDAYPQWHENTADPQLTTDIRRAFHTLKGSGRTVGYEALGEFAWQHEQLLNRVIEKDFAANSLVRDTVGDAISLLNVLQQQDEFVEHKGALLQQALVAERVRLSLMDAPQSEQDALDALSRQLRLSDSGAGTAPAATAAVPTGESAAPASEDWSAFDDITLADEPASAAEAPAIALTTDSGEAETHATASFTATAETTGDSNAAISLASDDKTHAPAETVSAEAPTIGLADDSVAAQETAIASAAPADFSGEESYDKALRTLQRGLRMGEPDADMQAALAETIRRQWQQSVADDPALREAMAQSLLASFQQEGGAQAQWVADILAQANAAGDAAVPVQPGLIAPVAPGVPQHETPHGISEQAYNRMLSTLRRGLATGADEDMQAVLSDSISRQWLQQGIATEGETRDDIIAHLKAALASEGTVDESVLDAMLAQVPHRVPSVLPEGVRQDSYGVMMDTLRASLDNASSADIQEMLATAIGNQWQNQNSLQDSAVRAAVAEQMAAVLGGDGHENAALVEAVLNRAAEKARETPAGLNPTDYEHLLETLRNRMGEAQGDAAQDAIAASISSQLQADNRLQDEATRDAIAQRVIAALGGAGETDAAAVEAILDRVAAKVAGQQPAPAALPAGVRPESYGEMLQTLRAGIGEAQHNDTAAEALAATIGAQWQEQHSLQDASTRAAVAQQISAALGGEADAATVEGILNRAAVQAAALPEGVKHEAYGEMLQTLRAGIANAQSDEAAAEALVATIGAQWAEPYSLQDPAARATVAARISAALGGEADAATIEGVLNRAAVQAAALPAGVKHEAYGEMLQTLRAGIANAQSDEAAADALAATIGAQWQEQHSLQDASTRAAVAQQISAALGGEADAATVEGILNRAAVQAAALPEGVKHEAYGEMLQTLRAGIANTQGDEAATEALAATIGAQWQEQHSLQDASTRAAVAQQISAALGGEADAATVEGILNRAAVQAAALPEGVKHEAYGEMLQTLRAGIANTQGDEAATEALAATIGAQWAEPYSLQDPAARATVAARISAALGGEADAATVEGILNRAAVQAAALPAGVKHEAYGEMLQTLRAGIGEAQHNETAAEALAATIGAQWQEQHSLQDASTRAAVAQQISAALGGEADAATVEGILNRAAVQAAALPAGVKHEAYGEMLQTLRAGIANAQGDEAAAEALAATIGAQWAEPYSLQDPAARATVAARISAALGGEADAATVEGILNRAAVQAAALPEGVKHEAYGEMLQTLRAGIANAQGDETAAEALAATIGAQWQEQHSLQDASTRAAVAQQISAALGGEADAATVEGILNRAAVQAAALPAGVKHEAYGEMLQTLRAGIANAQGDETAAEALAATIGAQWQEQHSLQDASTRAAVAQQISAALGGEADAATVEGILNRAAVQAAALPAGVKHEAYGEMLQTLRAGIANAQSDEAAAEALAATIGAQWAEPYSLQDPAARATVAARISAALGGEADAATVEGILNRAAVQAAALPAGVKHEAYGEMLQTVRTDLAAAQGDEAALDSLATMLAAQWEEPYSLQDAAARSAVAQQISAALGGEVDTATVEGILNRAAVQAAALPTGVEHEAYSEMLQTLHSGLTAAHGDSAVAQEMLAASIGAQWKETDSIYDEATRATVAARISASLGDKVNAATIEAILGRAAEKAAGPAVLPEEFPPEVYNRLLGMLRRGLQDGDADTQAALAATLQRHWQQNGLPQEPAAIAAVQQHLGDSLAVQGFAPEQVAQVFADAGLQAEPPATLVKAVLSPDDAVPADTATPAHSDQSGFVDATPEVVDAGFFDIPAGEQAAGDAEVYPENLPADAATGEGGFIDTATVPGDHPPLNDADIVDVPVSFAGRPLGGSAAGKPTQAVAGAVSIGDLNNILANMPRRANPAERLSQELASLAQHPGLENAINQEKSSESSAAASRAGFLRAVDQFDTLSQMADKTESPELVDDLIDAVYDIEDSIDSDAAPPWVWRLLDSIEQLLLTHKQEGTPVSLSCAAVLRQSANLIENYEEEGNEDDAIEAINSLLNARRELGGSKWNGDPASMPYSGDPLGSELVEDPNANTMLAETFIDEAMSLFAHSQEEAERWDENRSQLSRLDAIRRDMHTLKGSARMAGYNAIGDLTHGVESLIDGIVNGQAEPSSKATSILVGAMWQGMLMLDSVRDGYLPQTDPYILNNIHSYLNQPLPYPDVAEEAEAARIAQQQQAEAAANAPPVEEPVVEEVPIATDFDDNIDPVLVDIFTDEAQELLQTTSQLLEDDFSKKEVVEELQRTMHTLKGGARLVGFTAIGDTAHLMESVIDKVPELAESKVRQAKTLLHFGLDAHYDMLDSVLRHEMPQPALEVNESLKTFADSGVYRPPSQKVGDNADAAAESGDTAPENAEQPQQPAGEAADAAAQPSGDESMTDAADTREAPAHSGGDSSAFNAPPAPASTPASETAATSASSSAAHSDHAAHAESAASAGAGGSHAPAAAHEARPHDDHHHDAPHHDDRPTEQAHDKAQDKGFDGKPEGVESVIEYGNEQPEKKEEKKPEAAKDKDSANADNLPRYVRVDAQLLDEMIAMTGETAIMRSRMENIISEADFNLNELTRVAARIAEQMRRLDGETEAQLLYRREQQGEDDTHFDPLEMDRFTEIQQLSRQISEAIDDLKNLQDTLSQDNIILRNLSTQQGIIQRGIQDHLLTTQLMRFDVHEARLRRLVKQTAKSVGKDVNFVLEGGDVEVERRLLEDILPALEHMIRNSLAHGIEKPEERLAAGKPETGTIKLVVSVHAAELSVDLIDDGQGLNYDRIREKAEAKGLLDPERAHDEAYLSTLILRSGFSTAESLSQLAGRGVGMDVVNEMVKQRRGQIGVYSLRGKGTQFTLSMPFSMSIAEVLLVEIAGQTFAAPMSSIAAISQVDRDSLQRSFDGETVYQHYNDQDYRQYILGAYFKPEQYTFAVEEQSAPVLFINAGGEPVAFHVDRILNRLEIIVKNVNRQVLNIPGISGATILGDGRVVPVLELLDLSRRIANLTPIHDEVAAAEEARIPNVLVVDDSVTMRKVSTRLLERHHYNVATAKDGLDAIEVLANFTPDIILLDIEMPRMDGFEFASHVRNSSAVSDVPIVMITSRTGDKHRERADAIGVQGYLGKPYSEEVLIQTLEHLLKKRGEL